MTGSTDTYPVWTVRFTWRVTASDGQPLYTYESAMNETTAIDRAVFTLDHYQDTAARELVCVHVKRPDGTWSEVPRSNTSLTSPKRFGFQRPPVRPA